MRRNLRKKRTNVPLPITGTTAITGGAPDELQILMNSAHFMGWDHDFNAHKTQNIQWACQGLTQRWFNIGDVEPAFSQRLLNVVSTPAQCGVTVGIVLPGDFSQKCSFHLKTMKSLTYNCSGRYKAFTGGLWRITHFSLSALSWIYRVFWLGHPPVRARGT